MSISVRTRSRRREGVSSPAAHEIFRASGEAIFPADEKIRKRHRSNEPVLWSDNGVDHVEPHRHTVSRIMPGSATRDAQVRPSLNLVEARTICRSQHDGSCDLPTCAEPKSGISWSGPRSKEKVMQPSTDDLLIRQISALISATAEAASPSREYAPFMEARLYETLAAHCA